MARDHTSKLREWQKQGWKISKTSGGHMKMTHPEGIRPVFVSSTPSDYRAVLNTESLMRNALGQKQRRKIMFQRKQKPSKSESANV